MCAALGDAGLGQVLDIVPNHMAIVGGNRWWWDVLENGPSSQYASLLRRRLGPAGGQAAQHGADADPRRPLRPGARSGRVPPGPRRGRLHRPLLRPRGAGGAPVARRPAGRRRPPRAGRRSWRAWPRSSAACPRRTCTDRASVRERHRDKEVLRASLARLLREEPTVAAAVDAEVAAHQRRPRPARRPARAPELPAGLLAHRRAGAGLSALLRHPHPGRPAHGGRGRLRRHPRAAHRAGSTRGSSTGCASTTRRAARPRGLPAAPGTRGRRPTPGSWSRRSSSPASGCPQAWPVAGTTGLRLRQPRPAACSSTPPARSPSTRPTPPSPARPSTTTRSSTRRSTS